MIVYQHDHLGVYAHAQYTLPITCTLFTTITLQVRFAVRLPRLLPPMYTPALVPV